MKIIIIEKGQNIGPWLSSKYQTFEPTNIARRISRPRGAIVIKSVTGFSYDWTTCSSSGSYSTIHVPQDTPTRPTCPSFDAVT